MERKNLYITVGVVVVAIIVIVGVAVLLKQPPNTYAPGSGGTGAPSGPVTRTPAPPNTVVPSVGATNVPENVAVPQNVAPSNPAGTSDYRNFSVSADNDAFTPNTINIYLNDTVSVSITAVDKNYDFTQPDYGFKIAVAKGTTKTIPFTATAPGKFLFYCTICGGPQSGPTGYLVVVPKK